jgi:hypothetical protein
MNLLAQLDPIQGKLQEEFPGWRIWYVYRDGKATWGGQREPVLNTQTPDELRKAIRKIQAG